MILIHQLIGISTTFKNILLIQNIALKQKHLSNLQQNIIEKDETIQGLLDLDGRNSQKYLHQDQADF